MTYKMKWLAAAMLSLSALQAQAEHSDILIDVHNNALVVEADADHGGGALVSATGALVFEGDFRDFSKGPRVTSDPGFATHEDGVLQPNAVIGFGGVGSLSFWNGTSWTTDTAASVSVTDSWGAATVFSASGVTPGETSFIGGASSTGGFHSHIDFGITSGASVGAYMIGLQLFGYDAEGVSTIYAPSETFKIVFNNGLTETAFESSLASVSAVPNPSAAILMLSGLGTFWLMRRKRQQA